MDLLGWLVSVRTLDLSIQASLGKGIALKKATNSALFSFDRILIIKRPIQTFRQSFLNFSSSSPHATVSNVLEEKIEDYNNINYWLAPQNSVGEAAFLVLNLGCIKVNLKFFFCDHTSLDCRKSMGCTLEIPTMDTSMTEELMVSLSTQILR